MIAIPIAILAVVSFGAVWTVRKVIGEKRWSRVMRLRRSHR